jgi:hypothetical protein
VNISHKIIEITKFKEKTRRKPHAITHMELFQQTFLPFISSVCKCGEYISLWIYTSTIIIDLTMSIHRGYYHRLIPITPLHYDPQTFLAWYGLTYHYIRAFPSCSPFFRDILGIWSSCVVHLVIRSALACQPW